jgi:hypothetical protein
MYLLKFMLAWTDRRECVLCEQRPRSLVTGSSVCAYARLCAYMNISICMYWLLYKISNLYRHNMQREIETLFKISYPLSFSIGYSIRCSVFYNMCCVNVTSCRYIKCVWRRICQFLCVWNGTFVSDDLFEISFAELWLRGIREDRRDLILLWCFHEAIHCPFVLCGRAVTGYRL